MQRWSRKKSYWQQDIKQIEYVQVGVKGTVLMILIARLFYNSLWGIPCLIPLLIWYLRTWHKSCMTGKMKAFQGQFKDAMQALSAALSAGYSMENAIREATKDLALMYQADAAVMREFLQMERQLSMNIPVEEVLLAFSGRVMQEDVRNFVTVFVTAKRSGGQVITIIRNTTDQIADKIEVAREIQTIMAAKKLEFTVMTAIPFGILAYMRLSFPEFMQVLYGNPAGVMLMTVCLLIYLGAYYFGRRIVEIEV